MSLDEKNYPKLILLVAIAHAVTDLSQGALFVALPFFKAKFALSYAEVSFMMLMQNLTSSVTQPIFGYFSDRKHRPWLMGVGCMGSGLAMVAALLAPGYWWSVCFIAISGLGIAAFHPEGAKNVNRLSGSARGTGVSYFVVGGNAGFALGSLWLTLLFTGGEGANLGLYLLPSLLLGLILYKLAPQLPQIALKVQTENKFNITFNGPLLALLGMVLTRATIAAGIGTFIPLYYVSYLQGNELYASTLLTVFLAAGAAGTLVGGRLSDRFGCKRVMLWSILPVSALIFVFHLSSGLWIFVALALASALLSATFASSLVLAQLMMPSSVAMASGLTIGLSVGLGGMGVLALGKIADIWSLPVVFNILAVLPILGFLLTLFVKDISRPKPVGHSA